MTSVTPAIIDKYIFEINQEFHSTNMIIYFRTNTDSNNHFTINPRY